MKKSRKVVLLITIVTVIIIVVSYLYLKNFMIEHDIDPDTTPGSMNHGF